MKPQALLCDINFTTPAPNAVLRSAGTRITGTGSASTIVGDQG
ncbi:hypothetical protein QN379_00490 [Glaciimonas sp. Gout2]|nr:MULTISPECIES: hypothetical protein [unclassified Glaciimonas]MEB0012318.1 hypothetical protein [Glaciimonas sp. Cout2]MEB0080495.1 hypothetical protein [Glaciimonas sp. Gout2]